jgi:hypothetical protein
LAPASFGRFGKSSKCGSVGGKQCEQTLFVGDPIRVALSDVGIFVVEAVPAAATVAAISKKNPVALLS